MFVGLNPSTADANKDDPTIRRCRQFAKDWGFGGMYMVNLFAFRATAPTEMKTADDPIGKENNKYIRICAEICEEVVFAWGNHGSFMERDKEVIEILPNAKCIEKSKDGNPKHPLYLRKTLKLQNFLAKSCITTLPFFHR